MKLSFGKGTSINLDFYQGKSVIRVFEMYPLFKL